MTNGASMKANPTATLTKDGIKTIKERTIKGQQADAVVIKASELARIKESTKVIGKQQEMDEKKRLAEEKGREREAATTLRDKIKAFDQTRTKKLPATVYQKEAKEKNETLLTKAEKAMDEELDDVKHMNKMVHYAKCATVRDRQLAEMRELEKAKKDEDLKVDLMMEVERLKALQFHEEREKVHSDAQRQGITHSLKLRGAGDSGPDKGQGATKSEGARVEEQGADADVEANSRASAR